MTVLTSAVARANQARRPVLREPGATQFGFNRRLFRRAGIHHGRSAAGISEPQILSKSAFNRRSIGGCLGEPGFIAASPRAISQPQILGADG